MRIQKQIGEEFGLFVTDNQKQTAFAIGFLMARVVILDVTFLSDKFLFSTPIKRAFMLRAFQDCIDAYQFLKETEKRL